MTSAEAATSARLERVTLVDFRCFATAEIEFAPGLTVVVGNNGQGKTSLVEAAAWVARSRSFRGAPDAALVRRGTDRAIIRAEVAHTRGAQEVRRVLFEAEIRAVGRNRVLVNRQPSVRRRDRYGLLAVTVFSPDDLSLVKGGPGERRTFLDDLLEALSPRYQAARADYERVVRQRGALLRRGVRAGDDLSTLDVFDEQLVAAGAELVRGRLRLIDRLAPALGTAYAAVAGRGEVGGSYRVAWSEERLAAGSADEVAGALREALGRYRSAEIARAVNLVGPHRDDWELTLDGLDARTQASQGEQRTLALALRLAGHGVVTEVTGVEPVLLLDDVFSELDRSRVAALATSLPDGQTLLTTAGGEPDGYGGAPHLTVESGRVERFEPAGASGALRDPA